MCIRDRCYPSRSLRTSWPTRSPSQHPRLWPNNTTLHKYTLTPLWFSIIYTHGFTKLRFPNLIPIYKNSKPTSESLTSTLSSCNKVWQKSLRVPTVYTFLIQLNLPKWPQPSRRKQSPHPTYNSHTRRCSQPWALAEDIIVDTQLQRVHTVKKTLPLHFHALYVLQLRHERALKYPVRRRTLCRSPWLLSYNTSLTTEETRTRDP